MIASGKRLRLHGRQHKRPQARQWCRLKQQVNIFEQSWQFSASGAHFGATGNRVPEEVKDTPPSKLGSTVAKAKDGSASTA